MKVLAIILAGFVLQTSASFFDELHGAVTSVESSFGKLLNDVIYDVRETIDCTLMAVEQVLALGVFRDPSDYERRCAGTVVPEQPPPAVVVATEPPPPPVPEPRYVTLPLTKQEHVQVDSSILNVDQVLCDVLKKDDTFSQLESVKLALINETERLTEISELLKKQLEELSAEVKEKFKAIELQTSEPSVESIWNDIKLLHEIEHRHKNTDDAKKIGRVLDQILDILDANEEDRTAAEDYKIQEIMHKLSKKTKGGDSDIWQDLNNYPKDFRDYAKRVFDENRSTLPPDDVTEKPKYEDKESNAEKSVKIHKKDDQTDETEKKDDQTDETKKKNNQTDDTKKKDDQTDETKKKNDETDDTKKKNDQTDDTKKKVDQTDEIKKKNDQTDDTKKKNDQTYETTKKDETEKPNVVTTPKPKRKRKSKRTTTTKDL